MEDIDPNEAMAQLLDGVTRIDGVYNRYTGVGTTHDTRTFNSWSDCRRDPLEYDRLYVNSDIAKSIVDVPVEESFKNNPIITSDSEASPIEWLESLGAFNKIADAWKSARRVGGGAIWIEALGDPSTPMSENAQVIDLRVIDASQLEVSKLYNDPMNPKHREPELWFFGRKRLNLQGGFDMEGVTIHESRLIRIVGEQIPSHVAHQVDHWGMSVLHRVYDLITSYHATWDATLEAAQRGAQPVLSLGDMMGALKTGGAEMIVKRLELINRLRSSMRLIAIDQSEKYEFVQNPVASITPILESSMFRISAAAQIPVTKLFGMSPGGMNATGESDLENFYSRVESLRRSELTPILRRLLDLNGEIGEYTIEYAPLWELSEQERAAARKTQAEADAIYIQNGVVSPTEVSLSRFTPDGYSYEMGTYDRDSREDIFENPVGFGSEPSGEGDL